MPLSTHLKQGRLLYFTRSPDAISVIENDHLRWLTFDSVIQSVMKKQHRHRLTLPHHFALIQPLKYFIPKQVAEFGLGGGTMARFLAHYLPSSLHQIVESNKQVINCFNQFFDGTNSDANVAHAKAEEWTAMQHVNKLQSEWLIYDIYQHQDAHISTQNDLLFRLIKQLSNKQTLSINIPFSTTPQQIQLIAQCHLKTQTHSLHVYNVPHYQNKVFHLIPKYLSVRTYSQQEKPHNLPSYLLRKVNTYHQYFYQEN